MAIVFCQCMVALCCASSQAQVVISQIYGGGGNTSASWRNDFVELCNRGATPVVMSGWSLQYSSAEQSSWNNQKVNLPTVTLQPGQYYLIQLGSGGAVGLAMPAPDASASFNINATAGKVALVNSTVALVGVNPAGGPTVADFVGYGSTANGFEGTASAPNQPPLSPANNNQQGLFRRDNGCIDTDSNSSEFSWGTLPRPRTSASPRNVCALGLSETITDTTGVAGIIDGSLALDEYGASNSYAFGGDGSGFAGMIGYYAAAPLQPRMYFNSDGSGVNVGLQLGASLGAPADVNTVVLLLDTQPGGVGGNTTISINDGDSIQRAIARTLRSGLPSGFAADYAVGFNRFGVFSWSVSNAGLGFIGSGSGAGELASQFREIRLSYAQMNSFAAGSGFNFVVALNNGQESPGPAMADESIPVSPSFSGAGNPGNFGGTLTNYNRFVTYLPCVAPSISTSPQATIAACPGQTPTISVAASGTPVLAYLWEASTDNGSSWSPAPGTNTGAAYTLASLTALSQGVQYRVVVSNTCGSATSSTSTVSLSGTYTLPVSVQLQGITSGSQTRCLIFTLHGAGCAMSMTQNVDVNFTNGLGSTTFTLAECFVPAAVSVRDARHTLSRYAAAGAGVLSVSDPNAMIALFTNAAGGALVGGNVNDDQFVDILDFGGYIGQLGQSLGASTPCSTSGLHADFNGDGVVSAADFTFVSSNFLSSSESGACSSPVIAQPNQPGGPTTDVDVFELAAHGMWTEARADVNRDGRLNVEDVVFAGMHGVPTCTADFNAQGGVGVQDVFDFVRAWMFGHPAADMTRDHAISVQDLFVFLGAWFHGC